MTAEEMNAREVNENDRWLFKEPITHTQLVAYRNQLKDPEPEYTCDRCIVAILCGLVFDGYNTNGDCLKEK